MKMMTEVCMIWKKLNGRCLRQIIWMKLLAMPRKVRWISLNPLMLYTCKLISKSREAYLALLECPVPVLVEVVHRLFGNPVESS
jgi:hypothetical protein